MKGVKAFLFLSKSAIIFKIEVRLWKELALIITSFY